MFLISYDVWPNRCNLFGQCDICRLRWHVGTSDGLNPTLTAPTVK